MQRLVVISFLTLFILSSCATTPPAHSDRQQSCAPKLMVKMVVVRASDTWQKHEADEALGTMYRFGDRYLRLEEPENPKTKTRRVLIVNEPDGWNLDLNRSSGEHFVDRGPMRVVRSRILEGKATAWSAFEYGCEEEFMRSVGASVDPATDGAVAYTYYADGLLVRLFVTPDHHPMRIDVTDRALRYSISYLEHHFLEPDLSLFAPPPGVSLTEAHGGAQPN